MLITASQKLQRKSAHKVQMKDVDYGIVDKKDVVCNQKSFSLPIGVI
jgi:hypothetical protein